MRFKIVSVALLVCATLVFASPPSPPPVNDVPVEVSNIESDVIRKLNIGCASREATACMKLKILAYMNKLMKKASIEISEDVVLTQTSNVPVFVSSPRELDAEDDDSKLISLVTGKARSFLQSRELHWKLMPETDLVVSTGKDLGDLTNVNVKLSVNTARAVETARLKIKSLFAIVAAAIAKFGVVAAIKFAALVALVFKALIVSKLALGLAVIVGLTRLFSHQQHAVTYEVVSHPHVGHTSYGGGIGDGHHDSYSSGGYGGGGYGRSGVDNIAYNAHIPK